MSASASTRSYVVTVVGGIVAGGSTYFAASRAWAEVSVRTSGMPADRVSVDGAEAVPVVSAMALVVLASAVAVLAASPRVRLLVGAVMTAAALTAAVRTAVAAGAVEQSLAGQVGESPAMTGDRSAQVELAAQADPTVWRWTCLAAALVAVAAGVSVLVRGRRWPTMGRRYDAPSRAREDDDPWKRLDRGEDPTL